MSFLPAVPPPARGSGAAWISPIAQALVFDGASSLSRTPSAAGVRTAWTWAVWVRRTAFSREMTLFSAGPSAGNYGALGFTAGDALDFLDFPGAVRGRRTTRAVFRDTEWMHVCAVWELAAQPAAERMRLYVNAERVTEFSASANPFASPTVNEAAPPRHRPPRPCGGHLRRSAGRHSFSRRNRAHRR